MLLEAQELVVDWNFLAGLLIGVGFGDGQKAHRFGGVTVRQDRWKLLLVGYISPTSRDTDPHWTER